LSDKPSSANKKEPVGDEKKKGLTKPPKKEPHPGKSQKSISLWRLPEKKQILITIIAKTRVFKFEGKSFIYYKKYWKIKRVDAAIT